MITIAKIFHNHQELFIPTLAIIAIALVALEVGLRIKERISNK